MKIVLQIILTLYSVLYLFAGLNNRRKEQQLFYVGAASLLVLLVITAAKIL